MLSPLSRILPTCKTTLISYPKNLFQTLFLPLVLTLTSSASSKTMFMYSSKPENISLARKSDKLDNGTYQWCIPRFCWWRFRRATAARASCPAGSGRWGWWAAPSAFASFLGRTWLMVCYLQGQTKCVDLFTLYGMRNKIKRQASNRAILTVKPRWSNQKQSKCEKEREREGKRESDERGEREGGSAKKAQSFRK